MGASQGWVNAYRRFSDEVIWPRGMPLAAANRPGSIALASEPPPGVAGDAPIQQGLADGSPDVEAVWRLLMNRPVVFRRTPSLRLTQGQWCPINSQSTWWWPDAYPLLYLPSTCTFRTTDIWRGLVAQRCLWELGHGLEFHAAEVHQDRNPRAPSRDFEDELPGYLHTEASARCLTALHLRRSADGAAAHVRACSRALVD